MNMAQDFSLGLGATDVASFPLMVFQNLSQMSAVCFFVNAAVQQRRGFTPLGSVRPFLLISASALRHPQRKGISLLGLFLDEW